MRESFIEKQIGQYARRLGWKTMKLNGMGLRSKPDRMFYQAGKAFFLEIKRPGKKPTKQQEYRLQGLRDDGFIADWTDNIEEGQAIIRHCTKALLPDTPAARTIK
jgi:hypothetical protein